MTYIHIKQSKPVWTVGSETIPANLVTLCKTEQWARCHNSLKKKDWRTRGWGMELWFTVGQKGAA